MNKTDKMDLSKYEWPEITGLDMAFPTFNAPKDLLEEAKKRGYYNGNLSGNKMFNQLFFNGGKLAFKKDLPEGLQKAWVWCRAFMASWEPKHEEKEAIAAMILDEVLMEVKEKENNAV